MRETDRKMAVALGEDKTKYPSLNENVYIEKTFGKKSAFFNTIMMDGYVFNPYIHRRWLPVQYMELANESKEKGISVEELIKFKYSYTYSIKFVLQEIDKLCVLERYDKKAFKERSQFFTIECVKSVLINLMQYILVHIPTELTDTRYYWTPLGMIPSKFYDIVPVLEIGYWGILERKNKYDWTEARNFYNNILNKIKAADTYFEIKRVLINYPEQWSKLRNTSNPLPSVSPKFIEAFWKSGAYYTIKNKIMFQNGSVNGVRGNAAYKEITKMLDEGATASMFHEVYKTME